jgi:hypothetical protein
MHFQKQHSNGSFRWSVTADEKTVKVERACVNFFEAEVGQGALDELSVEVPVAEFLTRAELQDVVEQGFGTEGLDALLAAVGAPASGRSSRREAASQVGVGGSAPPVTAPDIVRGEEALQGKLSAYREGAAVTVYCRSGDCSFEEGFSGAAVAQFVFGLFLIALVPGLLGFGVWMGRRGS